jgi:hypothetical protein
MYGQPIGGGSPTQMKSSCGNDAKVCLDVFAGHKSFLYSSHLTLNALLVSGSIVG